MSQDQAQKQNLYEQQPAKVAELELLLTTIRGK
jgi:hypothetical protein